MLMHEAVEYIEQLMHSVISQLQATVQPYVAYIHSHPMIQAQNTEYM